MISFDTNDFPHRTKCFWYQQYPTFKDSIVNPYYNFRYRLRLRLDVTKLITLGITTRKVAQILENYIIRLGAIPSPTVLGFVDLFVKTETDNQEAHLDHILQNFLVNGDLEKIMIRGIPGITNYITHERGADLTTRPRSPIR